MLRSFIGIWLCFFASVHADGQDVKLVVQSGHSNDITAVKFSPDKSFIVTSGKDNRIVIWDRKTRKQYAVLKAHTSEVMDIVFAGSTLVSGSKDGTIIFWNFPSGEVVRKLQLGDQSNCLDYCRETKMLLSAGKQIWLINLDGKVVRSLPTGSNRPFYMQSLIEDARFHASGNRIVYTDGKGMVNTILTRGEPADESTQPKTRYNAHIRVSNRSVRSVAFDSDSAKVWLATYGGSLQRHDIFSMGVRGRVMHLNQKRLNDIYVGQRYLYLGSETGKLLLVNKKTLLTSEKIKAHRSEILAIDVVEEEGFIATASRNGVIKVWSIRDGYRLVEMYQRTVRRINDIGFSSDGNEIMLLYKEGEIKRFSLTEHVSTEISSKEHLGRVNDRNQVWAQDLRVEEDGVNADVSVLKRSSEFFWVAEQIRDYKVEWKKGFTEFQVERTKPFPQSEQYFAHIRHYLVEGAPLFLKSNRRAPTGNEGDENYHGDRVTASVMHPSGKFYATGSWDGLIKFWSADDHQLIMTLGLFQNDEFIMITPQNYYFSSRGALSHIAFRVEDNLYAFEQFDLLYNRPDLVLARLPGLIPENTIQQYHRAYQKRLKRLGIQEGSLEFINQAPQLDLALKQLNNGEFCELVLDGRSDKELASLHIEVNGVPEYGAAGKPLSGTTIHTTHSVELNPGSNRIRAYITSQNGVSSLINEQVIYSPREASERTLYLIAIGAGKYSQNNFNLNYAAKDARDVAAFMKRTKVFSQVRERLLIDEEVTKEQVEQLKDFVRDAGVNDAVLVFAAGHGVLSNDLDYFFGSYDIDFNAPELRGVPYEQLEDIFESSKSRYKIMLLDACHSGEIDKEEVVLANSAKIEEDNDIQFRNVGVGIANKNQVNAFEMAKALFADMRPNNGSTVISSAGGAEYALEGGQWQNGVFTYSMLNGMKSMAADLNKDGQVVISELHEYVATKVVELTNGKQRPTSRRENAYNDFRIH